MNPQCLFVETENDPRLSGVASLCVRLATCIPRKNVRLGAIFGCLPEILPESKCLDIGTGNGGLAFYYTKAGTWTYIDSEPKSLAVAKAILKGQFQVCDVLEFLSRRGKFSFITCIDTLMYFPRLDTALDLLVEGLEKGGSVLISESRSRFSKNPVVMLRRWLRIEDATGFVNDLDIGVLRPLLEKRGLRLEKTLLYYGPFTHVLQTLLDVVSSLVNSARKRQSDRLTMSFDSSDSAKVRFVFALSYILQAATFFSKTLDRVFFFLPRQGYVILATKL